MAENAAHRSNVCLFRNRLDYLYHLLDIHAYLDKEKEANCHPLKVLDMCVAPLE